MSRSSATCVLVFPQFIQKRERSPKSPKAKELMHCCHLGGYVSRLPL
jgi:hypothetical protein